MIRIKVTCAPPTMKVKDGQDGTDEEETDDRTGNGADDPTRSRRY